MALILLVIINSVAMTQWVDPLGRKPISYTEWAKNHKFTGDKIATVYSTDRGRGTVAIIVNGAIYQDIESEITRLSDDMSNEGYDVQVDTTSSITADALRTHLGQISGLDGAILIGEMPVAWFEIDAEFPIDLYFMDLNGNWIDADNDGVYDNHTGAVAPEIWIGRLYARNLHWLNEITLYKRYLDKNHAYRTGSLALPHKALTFIDDDWSSWTTCGLEYIYSTIAVVNDRYTTIAANYRDSLISGYEWIHLCSHSSPWGHTFKIPSGGPYAGTVFNYEIFYLEPEAHFVNLFACSGTRFVEENNSGNWYVFHSDNGLTVVGSAKTGSMLYFDDFYQPMGQGENFGDAFKEWFILHGEWSWDWFYGLNILGDPTLKPMMSDQYATRPTRSFSASEVVCPDPESDGKPVASVIGDTIWVAWESGRSNSNGRCDIYSAFRTTSWHGPYVIGPDVYWDYAPTITHNQSGAPLAVWSAYSSNQYNLKFSIYNNGWSYPSTISSDKSYDFRARTVTDQTGKVWLFWQSRRDVNSNIYYCTYTTSWSAPARVTNTPENEFAPEPVVDNSGRVWVFYQKEGFIESEIYGSYYDNGWVETGPISTGQSKAYHPIAAANNNYIWLVWHAFENGTGDIYYSRYDGSSWLPPAYLTTDVNEDIMPSITTDQGGTPWAVWQSNRDGSWQIYASYYEGGWQTPEMISDNTVAINPVTVCDNSNMIWFIWQGYNSNWEICADNRQGTKIAGETSNMESKFVPTIYRIGANISVDGDYQLFDSMGRMVINGKERIKTNRLQQGIYFLRTEQLSEKIILVK